MQSSLAGIAGLAVAKGLQLLGWETEIYEQASELKPLGAGLSLKRQRALCPSYDRALRSGCGRGAANTQTRPSRRQGTSSPIHGFSALQPAIRSPQHGRPYCIAAISTGPFFRSYRALSFAPTWNAGMHGRLVRTLPCASQMGRLWKASWCSLAMAFTPRFVGRCFRPATPAGASSRPGSPKEWIPRVFPRAGAPANASVWQRFPAKEYTGLPAAAPTVLTTPNWLRAIMPEYRRRFPAFTIPSLRFSTGPRRTR